MKQYQKIILIISTFIILVLAWAPWMDDEKTKEKVLSAHPDLRGMFQECPEPYVIWFPFGRWVGNCEGGWIITFWGRIL